MSNGALEPEKTISVSPDDQSSDRNQADLNQQDTIERLDALARAAEENKESTNQLAIVSAGLAQALLKNTETARTDRRRWVLTLVAFALLFVLAVTVPTVVGIQGRDQLTGCVEPGNACYDKANERSAQLINNLIHLNREGFVCAAYYSNLPPVAALPQVEKCVTTLNKLSDTHAPK